MSISRYAEYANLINDKNVLLIDDTISRGQTIKEACSIIKEQKDSCVYSFFYLFDLLANLKYILSIQSKYYNDKGIELLGFLRMIIMFQLVYNHNMYTLMDMPGQDVFNKQFYFLFFFYDYSINLCKCLLDRFGWCRSII